MPLTNLGQSFAAREARPARYLTLILCPTAYRTQCPGNSRSIKQLREKRKVAANMRYQGSRRP
jgi:hypothetical protein